MSTGIKRVLSNRLSIASGWSPWLFLPMLLLLSALAALGTGRFAIGPDKVFGILASQVVPLDVFWTETEARVIMLARLPRILMAMIVGGGLAMAGAALQGIFRNPLADPQIVGVSAGAAFGGVLALLLFPSSVLVMLSAFLFGMIALSVVYWFSHAGGRSLVLMLVLAGVVVGALFGALVSLITYLADPQDELPAIVFWLMGSFATASYEKVATVAIPVLAGGMLMYLMRFRINVMSLGDEDAETLGISVQRSRWMVLAGVTAITAATVAVAGVIGWVGLVIPHAARMMTGADHRTLLPVSALLGAIYMLIIDSIARSATAVEIPIGILTAIIGAPVFIVLLKRNKLGGWHGD